MAIIGKGVLGGFSGALGSVQGARQYGKDTIKERVRKPKNPRTAKQEATRDAMKYLQLCLANIQIDLNDEIPDKYVSINFLRPVVLKLFLRLLSKPPLQQMPFSLIPQSIDGDIYPYTQEIDSTSNIITAEPPTFPYAFNSSESDRLITIQFQPYSYRSNIYIAAPGWETRNFTYIRSEGAQSLFPNEIIIMAQQYCSADFTKFYTGSMIWWKFDDILL